MTHTSDTHVHDLPIVDRMRERRVPGVSVAVVSGGEIAETPTYGLREAGRDDAVTTSTRFQACSISKPVTVLAMLRLVEQGRLDLDADVNDTLRSWRVPPNGGWQPRVTLRQLASHSAGLTAHGFPGYPRGASLPTLPQSCPAWFRRTPRASVSTSPPGCSSDTPAVARPSCSCCSRKSPGHRSPT